MKDTSANADSDISNRRAGLKNTGQESANKNYDQTKN